MNKIFSDLENLIFKALCEKDKNKLNVLLDEIKNFLLLQDNNMGTFFKEFLHDISGKLTVVFLAFEINDSITNELDHTLCLLLIYKSVFFKTVDWISLEKYIKYEGGSIIRHNIFYNDFIDFCLITIHILFGRGKIQFIINEKHIKINNLEKPIWNTNNALMNIFTKEIHKENCHLEIEEENNCIIITKRGC